MYSVKVIANNEESSRFEYSVMYKIREISF